MRWILPDRKQLGRGRGIVVALVALLLMLGTTVQLTHIHMDGGTHQDCALCQSAHNVVRPAAAPPVRAGAVVVRRVAIPVTRHYRPQFISSWHWNRPPPDGTVYS